MEPMVGADAWERYWSTPNPDRRDRKWPLYTRMALLVVDVAEGRQVSVAEVGCGVGGFLDRLRGLKGINKIGFDIAPTAVEACKNRDHNAFIADAADLPVDGSFDIIVAIDLLGYLEDPHAALLHWRDLTPGGELIVADPYYDTDVLKQTIEGAGFSVTDERMVTASSKAFRIVVAK